MILSTNSCFQSKLISIQKTEQHDHTDESSTLGLHEEKINSRASHSKRKHIKMGITLVAVLSVSEDGEIHTEKLCVESCCVQVSGA